MNNPKSTWEQSVAWSKVVAGSVVAQDGKYLLVQEKQPRAFGLWCLPTGHVDAGESVEQAAVREVKEETGYDVELITKVAIYHEDVGRAVKHAFVAKITGGSLHIQPDEILDAKWLSYADIEQLQNDGQIRASWVFDAVTKVHKGQLANETVA